MLSIKENIKPDLPECKMNCDKPLHQKLEAYELSKFLNRHSCNLVLGKPGSGKTSLLYQLFKSSKLLHKVFHKVYIFRPQTSARSMKDDIFEKLPANQRYTELTQDTLKDVLSKISVSDDDECSCIIFDDMASSLKNHELLKSFKDLIFNRRHLHTSIFFLVQTFKSVPKELRKSFTNMFVFRVSKQELSEIFNEAIELDNNLLIPISNLVYDKPHNFLFVDLDSKRAFRNWDEIIFHED